MEVQAKAVPEVVQCARHAQPEEFTCFDPNCTAQAAGCVLCIKENHHTCKDEFILEADRLEELVTFQAPESVDHKNLDKFREIVTQKETELQGQIDSFGKAFDVLSARDISLFEQDEATLKLLKRFFEIRENPDTHQVEIKPIFQPENLQKCLDNYGEDLQGVVEAFEKELKEVQIELSGSLSPSKFKCHQSIEVSKKGSALRVRRKPGNSDFNYFAAILAEPLKPVSKFIVTIEGVNSGDPFLDIGIFDQSKLDGYVTSKVISFSSGAYSYCGTSQANLDGSAQGLVFKKGVELVITFDQPKGMIEFTTRQKSWSLKTTSLSKTDNYYFFVVLYHPESEVTVRKATSVTSEPAQ